MANYRYSASVVSRSKGQSVIARAAYNARTRLRDDRTGEYKDFSRKGGLEFQGIFAPKGAPEWAKDRSMLWNEVEKAEDQSRRRDSAQLARDLKISIPHELNKQQREWLVKDFARELARKGMVVDVTIHAPDTHSDERNYHVHMILTMRELKEEGFGHKIRSWNLKSELEAQRERWSELATKALERAGHNLEAERFRDSHKTLKKQREAALKRGDIEWADSLDREPTKHLGPTAAAMERRGVLTVNGEKNRAIEAKNETRAIIREYHRGDDIQRGREDHGDMLTRKVTKGGRKGLKIIEKGIDAIGNALDSLASPVLTPRQKAAADDARIQRELDEREARHMRDSELGRER